MGAERVVNHYFVDEAGDLTLFGRRGKVLVGTPGCSRFFMLAVAQLSDPSATGEAMERLRTQLLADPYFRGVPSMQTEVRKTALYFHANDDLPEVRREVFRLLQTIPAKVQVVVRRKRELVDRARLLHSAGQVLTENVIYDDSVKRLFRNLLHKADENRIVFARRGKSDRADALRAAIAAARANFERRWQKPSDRPTAVRSEPPCACPGLQVVDYHLWALQRLYERAEDRFFELLRPHYRLIVDLDDKRNRSYGEYYSNGNPLEAGKIKAF